MPRTIDAVWAGEYEFDVAVWCTTMRRGCAYSGPSGHAACRRLSSAPHCARLTYPGLGGNGTSPGAAAWALGTPISAAEPTMPTMSTSRSAPRRDRRVETAPAAANAMPPAAIGLTSSGPEPEFGCASPGGEPTATMWTPCTLPCVTRSRTWAASSVTCTGSLENPSPIRRAALRASALPGSAPPSGAATVPCGSHFPPGTRASTRNFAVGSPDHCTPTMLVSCGTSGAADSSPGCATSTAVFCMVVGGADGPAPAASAGNKAPRPATTSTNRIRRMGGHLRRCRATRRGRVGGNSSTEDLRRSTFATVIVSVSGGGLPFAP